MMFKKRNTPIALLLVFVLLFSPMSLVLAQGEGFTEAFDDPTLPGWEKSNEAIVVDGVLRMAPGSFALRMGDWSEINLTVKMKYSGEGNVVIHTYFRDRAGYILNLAGGSITLDREQDGTRSTLGSGTTSLQPDTWLELNIAVTGSEHQIRINNEQVLTASDPQPLEAGALLFESMGGATVEFDDLTVRGTPGGGPPPGEEPPPPAEGGQPPPSEAGTAPDLPAGTQPATGSGSLVEEFFASQASTIELSTFLVNLILAAVCSYILSVVYIHWGASLTNRRKFAANFLLMTVTTTFIIMVVRSSVALSLGLVGALSIVRFRAAVKEPEELAYLFFALGIGIGLGDNQRMITLIAMAAGIGLIALRQIFRKAESDVNLHVSIASRGPSQVPLEQITETLRRHTAKIKLLRFDETAEALEVAYLIEFRRMDQLNEARAALKALSGSLEITFMDNKGIW
jgi:hypothetical protein